MGKRRELSRRARHLPDIAIPETLLRERELDMRDQFVQQIFDSKLQTKLCEDERDRDFQGTMQRAQELELFHRTQESKRERILGELRYNLEQSDVVRAVYSNNNRIEEQLAAQQTLLTKIAIRLDCSDFSIR